MVAAAVSQPPVNLLRRTSARSWQSHSACRDVASMLGMRQRVPGAGLPQWLNELFERHRLRLSGWFLFPLVCAERGDVADDVAGTRAVLAMLAVRFGSCFWPRDSGLFVTLVKRPDRLRPAYVGSRGGQNALCRLLATGIRTPSSHGYCGVGGAIGVWPRPRYLWPTP